MGTVGIELSVSVGATTNRITTSGYAYDASGDMTNDGVNTLVYDGENRVTSAASGSSSGTYTYDGNGIRVKKVSGSTTTVTIFSGGLRIAEYVNGVAPSAPTNEYIYSGSQIIAAIQSGTTYYFHNDHLSLRARTNTSGTLADQRGHYPFGETWYSPSGAPLIFTSYYRDSESGNDYAMARSYVNRLGRFSSPDPLMGSVSDPQSLNRYAYAGNDPGNLVDPSGLGPCRAAKVPSACGGETSPRQGGGSGVNCTLDGVWVPCDWVSGNSGAFGQCPDNDCSPRAGDNGTLYPIVFTDDGFEYRNPNNGDSFGSADELGLQSLEGGIFQTNTLVPPGLTYGQFGDAIAGAQNKIRNDEKCRAFITKLVQFLYGANATADQIADRLGRIRPGNVSFSAAAYGGETPGGITLVTTLHHTYSVTLCRAGLSQSPAALALTFMHEAFHMGPRARTDQQMWQATIGNHNIMLPRSATSYASRQWGQKLKDNC